MRISDAERREVARRLREMSETESVAAMLDLDDDVRTEMTLRVIRAIVGKGDIFEKLADLIDRPTTTRHGKFRTKYGRETPCCEVCGYSIGDMRWNHCPKCGAVIADD